MVGGQLSVATDDGQRTKENGRGRTADGRFGVRRLDAALPSRRLDGGRRMRSSECGVRSAAFGGTAKRRTAQDRAGRARRRNSRRSSGRSQASAVPNGIESVPDLPRWNPWRAQRPALSIADQAKADKQRINYGPDATRAKSGKFCDPKTNMTEIEPVNSKHPKKDRK